MKSTPAKSRYVTLVDKCYSFLVKVSSSNYFFLAILVLIFLQGLWFAFSFVPGLFDEFKHMGRINVYSHFMSPFISVQKEEWDVFSSIPRDPYYFYYFIMSWPLRVVRLFTTDTAAQTIALRVINISFFLAGVIFYRMALLATKKISKSVVNVVLLILVLTPAVAPLPGAVNYDSAAFMLFGLLLLYLIRAINSKKPDFVNLSLKLITGMLMVMVKWTTIALFVPMVLFLLFDYFYRYRKNTVRIVLASIGKKPKYVVIILTLLLVVLLGLLIERPVYNTVKYGRPEFSCDQILSVERCLKHKDYEVYNNVSRNKPKDFVPEILSQYTLMFWIPRIINTHTSLLPWNATKLSPSLPMMANMYSLFAYASVIVILVNLKDLLDFKIFRFLLFTTISFVALLIIFLYSAYSKYAIPAAINSRYLLPILPIVISLSIVSIISLAGKYKKIVCVLMMFSLVLYTQGGGIITQSLTAQDRLYWNSKLVRVVNKKLQASLHRIVIYKHSKE